MTYDPSNEPIKPEGVSDTVHILLRQWAQGDKADIMPTVDEQIRLLGGGTIPGWGSSGPAKTYMSEWMAYKAHRLFAVGSEWTLHADGQDLIPSAEDGKKVTVLEPGHRKDSGMFGGIRVRTTNGMSWLVRASHLRPLDSVVSQGNVHDGLNREELLAALGEANADTERLRAQFERANTRANRLYADLETVNRLLNQFAEEKDYCDEYEEYLDKINAEITSYVFEGREEEFEVQVRVPATVWATGTVTVTARRGTEHDELQEMALESVDSDDVEIDTYDADYAWDSAEAEVQ